MKILTPRESIRAFCRECSGTFLDVKFCSNPDCRLWPHRLGTKEAAVRKYGAEIFNKENFREGGKFAPPTEATVIEARFFPRKPSQRPGDEPQNGLSEPGPSTPTGEDDKNENSGQMCMVFDEYHPGD